MAKLSWTESYGDGMFMDFDMTKLKMDQAYMHIINNNDISVYMYRRLKECINCPFQNLNTRISINQNITKIIDTRHDAIYRFLRKNVDISPIDTDQPPTCELDYQFGEFGVYNVHLNGSCIIEVLKEPVNIYFPIVTVFLIYSALILIPLIYFLRKKIGKNNTLNHNPSDNHENVPKKERLRSLDTFRGISITLMIFVNYGGGGYELIEHTIWNGLHLADLVFPWFMWIMGVCIPISVTSVLKRNIPTKTAFLSVLKRSCILFALGLFLGASTNLNKLRIFGVLQRFGICYFIVTTLCLLLMKRKKETQNENGRFQTMFKDILRIKFLWFIVLIILGVHCLILFLLADLGCPRGYLGPGGLHENGKYFNCTGGATGYVDRTILGNHVFRYPTIVDIYKSQTFDPEGILGCLTSVVQVFIGVQAGITLLTFKSHGCRITRWLSWAVLSGLIGAALCGFSKEDGVIPVNKNLWSISFVLVTSSFAFILLSICYILIDIKKYWSGKPFLYAGMNAILMYIGHSMTYGNFPIRWYLENTQTHFVTLIENVWATMIWLLIAYYLYKIKYFFSI